MTNRSIRAATVRERAKIPACSRARLVVDALPQSDPVICVGPGEKSLLASGMGLVLQSAPMMNKTCLSLLGAALFVVMLGGCESFDDRFKAASVAMPPVGQVTGAWTGSWQSATDADGGKLKAIVTRVEGEGEGETYKVSFKASYAKILTSEHSVTLKGQRIGSTVHFEGDKDLGFFAGGQYKYSGYMTPTEFFSTYQAQDHSGSYTLKRVFTPVKEGEPAKPQAPESPSDEKPAEGATPQAPAQEKPAEPDAKPAAPAEPVPPKPAEPQAKEKPAQEPKP